MTTDKNALTEHQEAVLDFIMNEITDNHRPPTATEVADHFIWSSPNTAYEYFKILQRKGYIRLGKGARNIKIIGFTLVWQVNADD